MRQCIRDGLLIKIRCAAADEVCVYIPPSSWASPPGTLSLFTVDPGQLLAGEINLNSTTVAMQTGNEYCLVDYDAKALDASLMDAVIAGLETIVAAGPVVTEAA